MSQQEVSRKRGRPRTRSPKPKTSRVGQGTVIRGQGREFVCSVREYFELECQNRGPLIHVERVVDRTAAALRIHKNTVYRIGKEKEKKEKENDEAGPSQSLLETPGKKRNYEKRVTKMDAFQQDAVRRHLYGYYLRKEHPTLNKLLHSLREAELFNGSKSSLRNCLHELGFQYEKFSSRTVIMERSDIVAWRCRYLRAVRHISFEDIVWLDETWVNAGHTLTRGWTDRTVQGTMKAPLGRGGRIIVLHAGSARGFMPNCLLLFRSRKQGDYHEEMNATVFTEWFCHSLLPNIPPNSTIVMDNAPYHSVVLDKAPTMQWRKADILLWVQKNVPAQEIEADMNKAELMELVNMYKPKTQRYEIDELAKAKGHSVIRLPPYHAHFNPIENIWAQVKGHVAKNNKKFTVSEVEVLTRDAIENIVTTEDWARVVNHARTVTEEAWVRDGVLEVQVEEMVICLGSNSSSSSENESDDSSLGVAPLSP